jgi:hypothetical protein
VTGGDGQSREATGSRGRGRQGRHLYRALPALAAVAFAAWVMRSADLARVGALVVSLGWRLPLLLLPTLAITLVEAFAWWRSFSLLGPRPPFAPLVRVRLATEAVMLSLPSGALISETLQPYLLKKRCSVSFETAVAAAVGRKFLVVVSHGLVLSAATLIAWPTLHAASRVAIGRGGLPWLLLASGLFLVTAFGIAVLAGTRVQLAERTRLVLERILGQWLGGWLTRNAMRFRRTDEQLAGYFQARRRALVPPMLLFCATWVARGLETLLFLRLLGASVSLTAATVLESALVLLRSAAVPMPGGLGVQDAAYVLSLRALGVPDAITVGTALVVLKRGRDLFWIVVGAVLLGTGAREAARSRPDA